MLDSIDPLAISRLLVHWPLNYLPCFIPFKCFHLLIHSFDEIGNAYGIAELGVMMMTTILVTLVMLLIWQIHIIIVLNFVVLFLGLEGCNLGTIRAPRIGLLYNELVKGIPAIFGHFLTTLPEIHSMIIFVSIKCVPVPMVLRWILFLVMTPKFV